MPQHSRRTYNTVVFALGECSEKCSDHPSRRAGKGCNHIAVTYTFCTYMITSANQCQTRLEVCKTFMRRFDPDPRLHILLF
jgi:hypothetical protein